MKESRFNVYFQADDGIKLAFNSLSCGLAIVDDSYDLLMKSLPLICDGNVPNELLEVYQLAKEGNFIVDDQFDELCDLETKRNFQKYNCDNLGLTIAPTLSCNFKCIYCYETSKPGIMTSDVQDKLIDFVKGQADHLRSLSISWYGGEPLLAKQTIYDLSERFIKICSDKGIEYNAFMISNGSLIDDDIIQKMIKYHINGIQITIDGPAEIHNSRRISRSGDGTFDLIIDNINKLLATEQIEVVIRINVDKTNNSEVEKLISIMKERLINNHVKITFGQVTAYTEACKSIESSCYDNGEFAVNLLEYYDIIEKYEFDEYNPFPYPEAKCNYCCAELLNSFVVDHEGYLYKCWNEVGDTKCSIGNIIDENFDLLGFKNGNWVNYNPINNNKCSVCELLPVCMGGCPHNTKVLNKENVCDLIRYNIKDVMNKYYNKSKEV